MISETIERKAMVFAVDDNTYIPVEITENTSRPYSCGVVGKSVMTGMTFDEIMRCPSLMSQIGVSNTDPKFVEKAEEFWSDWKIDCPISRKVDGKFPNARIIDGSYQLIGETKTIVPVDVNEYIAFNIMLKDSSVGKNDEDFESLDQFDYFMFDLGEQEKKDNDRIDKTRQVTMKMAEILVKPNAFEITRQILINSKQYSYYDINQMSEVKASEELFKFADKQADEFLKIAENKHLGIISFANEIIAAEIVSKAGDQYFINDEPIGNFKELVQYLNRADKEVEVLKLKSALETIKLRDVIDK